VYVLNVPGEFLRGICASVPNCARFCKV